MDADGSNQTKLFGGPLTTESEAFFSPDGQTILYPFAVVNFGAAGNASEQPAMSPDGAKIVFANGSGGDTIWIMNADGTLPTVLGLGVLVDNGQPAWQPVRP